MAISLPDPHPMVTMRTGKPRYHRLAILAFFLMPPVASPHDKASGEEERGFFGIEVQPFTEPVISTERPNFSASPIPLASGRYQIESGLQYTEGDGGAEDFTLPLALLRAGLARNLELQIGWVGYSSGEEDGDSIDGANDVSVALKTQLTEQAGPVPALGLIGQLSLPTGSSETSSDSLDPSLGALWTYDLQRDIGLFGTVLFSSLTDDEDDRFFQTAAAAGVGFPIADRLGSYVEYFGIFPDGGGPEHNVNTALLYLVNNLLLDAVIGAGLNDAAPDYFVGGGVSYRW